MQLASTSLVGAQAHRRLRWRRVTCTSGRKPITVQPKGALTAVTAAMAPVCAAKFKGAGDAGVNMAALQKIDSWQRGEFIEKGGWATVPGAAPEQSTEVAKACAALLITA